MAVGTDPEFLNLHVSPSATPSLIVTQASGSRRKVPYHPVKFGITEGRHFLNLDQVRRTKFKHRVYRKSYSNIISKIMRNSDMNDSMDNIYLERKLRDYSTHGFDRALLMEEDMLSPEVDSREKPKSRFSSPIDDISSRSSKSPNSIEDLNKEIERLFLNNEKFGFTSFIWDADDIAEGRRAPIADMLHCCKGLRTNRRKKRRIATALAIRNYNESDSSNGISSPDENSGCEEYNKNTLIENLYPPIIVPVPGKSGIDRIDQVQALNISSPFSRNTLQLSEDSAFAPIKSIPRSQSTPPQSTVDM